VYGSFPVFWTLPTTFLAGTAAAAGLALINSLGNLAGYFGPQVVEWLTAGSGDYSRALFALGMSMLAPAVVVVALRSRVQPANAVPAAATRAPHGT
jgi:nitrate/nitrite transporter NarK